MFSEPFPSPWRKQTGFFCLFVFCIGLGHILQFSGFQKYWGFIFELRANNCSEDVEHLNGGGGLIKVECIWIPQFKKPSNWCYLKAFPRTRNSICSHSSLPRSRRLSHAGHSVSVVHYIIIVNWIRYSVHCLLLEMLIIALFYLCLHSSVWKHWIKTKISEAFPLNFNKNT